MAANDDTAVEKANWHWRNTMRPVRFFGLDARAAIPYCLLLVYARPVTLFLAIISTIIFWFLERRGLTFPSALRAFRIWIIGDKRPSWLPFKHRRLKDFG